MAREFGQLESAMWRDDKDWRALPADAQWLYGLLISQSNLSAAGALELSIHRWQRMCDDMSSDRFTAAMAVLEDRLYVVIDLDTEELLVRSFARRKTQWTNPKRVGALRSAVAELHSIPLKQTLADELARVNRSVEGLPEPSTERLTERLTETRSDSVERLTERLTIRLADVAHETGDGRRESGTATAAPPNGQFLLRRFLDAFNAKTGAPYPDRSKGHLAGEIGKLLNRYDGDTLSRALDRLLERGLGPSKLPDCVADVLNPTPRRNGATVDGDKIVRGVGGIVLDVGMQ